MVKGNDRSEKESYLLVRFFYGAELGDEERYTDWTQDTQGFVSTPTMEIEVPPNTGTFDEKEMRIEMPQDAFTLHLTEGAPTSAVYVEVTEVTQGLSLGERASEKVLYSARVLRAVRNYQGRQGGVALFALARKGRMDVSLGFPCSHHCPWTLFGAGCELPNTAHRLDVTIDAIDGKEVTVTNLSFVNRGNPDERYWQRGYFERAGIILPIRFYNHDTGPDKVYTARRAPSEWLGQSVTAFAGCSKVVAVCRSRFDNERGQGGRGGFGGSGIAIPAYEPRFESE